MSNSDTASRPLGRLRTSLGRRLRHPARLSRHSLRFAVFLAGAALVSLFSLAFAWLAELMLHWNRGLTQVHWWSPLILLPFGFAGLRWLTMKFAPQARGSGIPQVIAAISLPSGSHAQGVLVSLRQSFWKIILTAGGLFSGASIGREGPSVQVGAAVMLAWGRFWHRKFGISLGFRPEALVTAGAAGGLAAAFNTPLAGVVFAIEELGRGSAIRWDRLVLSGVLAAGFLAQAVLGNHPYFHISHSIVVIPGSWEEVMLCALIAGVLGGLFAKSLVAGLPAFMPSRFTSLPTRFPLRTAFLCGLLVALIGLAAGGSTYGTSYDQAADMLNGKSSGDAWFGLEKLAATVISYFAGIPGGIFTPSLAIGAGIGNNIGMLLDWADPRLLVLVSMGAFLAAATQSPITASVIVMEMTRSQDLTLYLLAATLTASFISRQFSPRPFYHQAGKWFRHEARALQPNAGGKAA